MKIKNSHNFIDIDVKNEYAEGILLCTKCGISFLKIHEDYFFNVENPKFLSCEEIIIKNIIE